MGVSPGGGAPRVPVWRPAFPAGAVLTAIGRPAGLHSQSKPGSMAPCQTDVNAGPLHPPPGVPAGLTVSVLQARPDGSEDI